MRKYFTHIRISIAAIIAVLGLTNCSDENQLADRNNTWKGNKAYEDRDFEKAASSYDKSMELSPSNTAQYNKANALYKQQRYKEAAGMYQSLAKSATDTNERTRAYHNAGNAFLKMKELDKSIESYKSALRVDPTDEETRYNLSYALKMKQEQEDKQDQNKDQDKQDQDQEQQENQDQEQQKDQQQDQKEDQEKQDQQNQDQQEQDKQDQQQQQQQPQPNEVSKEDAARMLENLENEEEKTQEQMQLEKRKASKSNIENDW